MTAWEYRFVNQANITEDRFNALGERGWEVDRIATVGANAVAIFRRPIPIKRTGTITYSIKKKPNGNFVLSIIEQGEREEIETFAAFRPALAGLERVMIHPGE